MCLMSFNAYSQQKDTVDFVNFEEAKHGVIFSKEKMSIFTGEVAFNHKGVYFYADTVIRNDQMIRAIGNVLIQQGDTLAIFADSLHYNADTRQCDLFSDVSFTKGRTKAIYRKAIL
jgi:lipopolysaccharide assembly outer membrane protein LptD (OstA)